VCDVNGGLIAFGSLKASFGVEEGFVGDDSAEVVEGFLFDEEVGDSGFVFE